MLTKRFSDWLDEDRGVRIRLGRLRAKLPGPYRRERSRDPEKARLLRERGVPEDLIGPESRP